MSEIPANTETMFKGKYKGRLSRKEFLWQSVGYGIPSFIALAMIGNSETGEMGWIIGTMFGIAIIPMFLITHIKRFHDLGFSGWWILLEFTFFANILIWPVLYFLKGNYGPNLYGFDLLIDYEKQKKSVEIKDGVLLVKKLEFKEKIKKVKNKVEKQNYDNLGWDFD